MPPLRDTIGANASAGQAQSPAVRIVVDREREIREFRETKHFDASVTFDNGAWPADWYTEPNLTGYAQYILNEALAKRTAACSAFAVAASDDTTLQREAPIGDSLVDVLVLGKFSLIGLAFTRELE